MQSRCKENKYTTSQQEFYDPPVGCWNPFLFLPSPYEWWKLLTHSSLPITPPHSPHNHHYLPFIWRVISPPINRVITKWRCLLWCLALFCVGTTFLLAATAPIERSSLACQPPAVYSDTSRVEYLSEGETTASVFFRTNSNSPPLIIKNYDFGSRRTV